MAILGPNGQLSDLTPIETAVKLECTVSPTLLLLTVDRIMKSTGDIGIKFTGECSINQWNVNTIYVLLQSIESTCKSKLMK